MDLTISTLSTIPPICLIVSWPRREHEQTPAVLPPPPRQKTSKNHTTTLENLPILPVVTSGESFGLVNIATGGGKNMAIQPDESDLDDSLDSDKLRLSTKQEDIESSPDLLDAVLLDDIEVQDAARHEIIEDLHIDPALLDIPQSSPNLAPLPATRLGVVPPSNLPVTVTSTAENEELATATVNAQSDEALIQMTVC